MPRFVSSITVNAQGASDDFNEARERALDRLMLAAEELHQGNAPAKPGVQVDDRDPGGGGGPCMPRQYSIDVIVDVSVLPEAQSSDD